MVDVIPEFGTTDPGIAHQLRPGGYVVILQDGMVGVVSTPAGLVLPGGGQEANETPESAAVRETAKECGLQVTLGDSIGIADEFVFAADEQTHYRKRCTFFQAKIVGASGSGKPDHKWVWLSVDEAIDQLRFASQRWALAKATDAEPSAWEDVPPADWPLPDAEWIAEAQRRSVEYDEERMPAATWPEVQARARRRAGLD